jgi:subtilase family serine protease
MHSRFSIRHARALTSSFLIGLAMLPSSAAAASKKARPDLQFVSFKTSHDKLSPGSNLMLTFSVGSKLADAPAFDIGLYYAFGADAPPTKAKRLSIETAHKGVRKDGVVTFSVPVMVPQCDECGPLKLTAYIDPLDRLDEERDDNNRTTAVVDLQHSFVPDLRVPSVKVTPYGGTHTDRVNVDALIHNHSTLRAQGPFRLSVYCSPDPELTTADVRLYSLRQETLAPEQTFHFVRDVRLPPTCNIRGMTTWVGIIADDTNEISERNEQNNANSFGYWVVRAADLTPGKMLLSNDHGPALGQVSLSFQASNRGRDRASSFKIGVYLSSDSTITPTDTLLDTISLPSLAANTESGTLQSTVAIPSVPKGRYYLGALVDVYSEVGELRERNNFKSEPYVVDDVDLTDQYFLVSQNTVSPDSEVQVDLAVKNRGADDAPASRAVVYYSDDPHFDRSVDVALTSIELAAVKAGQHLLNSAKIKIPSAAQEGYRFLLLVSDEQDKIYESNERNNVALRAIRVVERH